MQEPPNDPPNEEQPQPRPRVNEVKKITNPAELQAFTDNIAPTCGWKGCGKPALFQPVIKIWAKGHTKKNSSPIAAEIGIAFCQQHKDEGVLKISDFKIEDLQAMAEAAVKAYGSAVPPDASTAVLVWRPLIRG